MKRLLITLLMPFAIYANDHQLQTLSYHEPSLSFQTAKAGDSWIGTVSGVIQATEEVNISAEIDSEGYLELGTGYGVMLGDYYTEAFISYGRADFFDIYDIGLFSGTALTNNIMVFGNTSHEWRKFPLFDLSDASREWKSTIGTSYSPTQFMNFAYSFSHDRQLTGSKGYYNSQDVTFTLKPKWVEPYVKYTFGQKRVSPSDRTRSDGIVELGFNLRF
ncbi:hypothetical protein CWN88_15310 [Vibrio splendidus]|uniref:hypothetical protein n=1 Tax=Vibrio splendidus TaxID=29497 RepID=UPI000D354833|nr:hypothetical protein [Vibrio splendidus]PTP00360.1 hypothetical protein CWN88_15310 [Vibrio splendidus]